MRNKLLLIPWVVITLVGCSSPIEDLPAPVVLENSTAYMRSLDGFSFRLARTGAPVFVDPTGVVTFREAAGSFVAPDRVQATVKVIAPAIVAEVSIIGIGDEEWETNIFSGEWVLVPPEYAFQPGVLFDPEAGIQQALVSHLTDLQVVDIAELEEVPGLSFYHLRGMMDGAKVHDLTFGLIDAQPLEIELWISPGDFALHRAIIADPANESAEEGTIWQFDFWDFGSTIEILPPI